MIKLYRLPSHGLELYDINLSERICLYIRCECLEGGQAEAAGDRGEHMEGYNRGVLHATHEAPSQEARPTKIGYF